MGCYLLLPTVVGDGLHGFKRHYLPHLPAYRAFNHHRTHPGQDPTPHNALHRCLEFVEGEDGLVFPQWYQGDTAQTGHTITAVIVQMALFLHHSPWLATAQSADGEMVRQRPRWQKDRGLFA